MANTLTLQRISGAITYRRYRSTRTGTTHWGRITPDYGGRPTVHMACGWSTYFGRSDLDPVATEITCKRCAQFDGTSDGD